MKNNAFVIGCKIILIVIIWVFPAKAQKTATIFSLQQCVDLALSNNINIQQRELNIKTASADGLQSKLALLPSLNGAVTNNYNTGFAIDPLTNTTQRDITFRSNNFSLNSSMTLFNGFQNSNNVRLQQSNQRAVNLEVAAAKNNLSLQVANAYMQVLLNTEVLQSRLLQIQATREQLKRQQKMYDLGNINKVKLLQIKAQLTNEESAMITAQTQLDQAYLSLWQLINITPDTANKIVPPDPSFQLTNGLLISVNEVYQEFLSKSPDALAAKERERAAQLSYFIAAGGRSPRITMSGGVNSFYTTQNNRGVGAPIPNLRPIGVDSKGDPIYTTFITYPGSEVTPFNDQFNTNLGKSLGFTLSMPIFNGWQVNTNIQKQRINQINTKLAVKQTELDIYKNVQQAYLDLTSAEKKFSAAKDNFDANKEAYLLAESQFNLGALNTADFISTKNQYLQAETNMLQSKYELLFRKKVMDFYLGKSLY
ncbi:MAG: TolC family protein [Bacteroidetes bacterium]|nr:MAG: TolC family protein [Bacteroidota bacterium]